MWNRGFEGWYFKHQKGEETIAFIPGRAESGAFIQILDGSGSRQFPVPSLVVARGAIRAGDCVFSRRGVVVDLPGVQGKITYGALTPLRSDIMGPFRFLPMECRHGVLNMGHTLAGSLVVDGKSHRFDGGRGYLELDSGTSFPRSYLWLQCNDFPLDCSIMVSIAHIPFAGTSFTGCICAIVAGGREYRLATYCGVAIHAAGPEHICLSQGGLLLEVDIAPGDGGHPLRAPVEGRMSATIRESSNAAIRLRLWEKGRKLLDLRSRHAAFEWVK